VVSNLNLQHIISANALIVHLMVGIISVTTTFVFNKCKSTFSVNAIRVDIKGDQDTLTDGWSQFAELECHNEQGDHSYCGNVSLTLAWRVRSREIDKKQIEIVCLKAQSATVQSLSTAGTVILGPLCDRSIGRGMEGSERRQAGRGRIGLTAKSRRYREERRGFGGMDNRSRKRIIETSTFR
jgi:hypothetical protein